MDKKQQKKQKQERKADDYGQSDEEIMNLFNAKKQQEQKSKKPKKQDNSPLIPEQIDKSSKGLENQKAQKKQNPNEAIFKNPLHQTQKTQKSNQTVTVLGQAQQQKQDQNKYSHNIKREQKESIRWNKQQSQQNNVPKKQQKEPKKEQNGQKNQLHEDSDLFSHKYQIRKLQTKKGTRAPSKFEIMDKNRKPFSIMAWNVWGDYHQRQQNDRQTRYREIINEINTKKPDIVCLQEMQKFREQPYFVNLLQTLVGSSYYYAEPSFNSTIILCKTNANFYEVKFVKGLKTKPMTVCTFNMKCSDSGKIRSVVVHSVHLKSRLEEGTKPIRQLQLRTIHKINKKFDVNIMAGDFNFDDVHPQDVDVRYSYLDLQHHHKNKNREDLLPENKPVEEMRMQPQQQLIRRQENVGHLDGFLGYLSDSQSWNSSDMEREFESEDSFDGYSVSWWSDFSGNRDQDFSEDQSSDSRRYSDQDDDDSDDDDESSDDMSEEYESQSDQGSDFDDDQGDYDDDDSDKGPRYSRNDYYQRKMRERQRQQRQLQRQARRRERQRQRRQRERQRERRRRQKERKRAQRERMRRQRQNRREQRGRQRERSRERRPHPDRPRFILPRNEEDAIWTHMYYDDKSLNRFDRILMFCPEYSKRALMKKANVVKFERLGTKGVGRYVQQDCMQFLRDKIVRTPSDHFGVFANMFLNFHST